MGDSTNCSSITDEDRARLDRLAERLSGGDRSALLPASQSVTESIERANRLRDLAVIAEEHAAERGVTEENILDVIKTSYKRH
jgi:predicted transcriptional regulator